MRRPQRKCPLWCILSTKDAQLNYKTILFCPFDDLPRVWETVVKGNLAKRFLRQISQSLKFHGCDVDANNNGNGQKLISLAWGRASTSQKVVGDPSLVYRINSITCCRHYLGCNSLRQETRKVRIKWKRTYTSVNLPNITKPWSSKFNVWPL